jgi:hypothetical protein
MHPELAGKELASNLIEKRRLFTATIEVNQKSEKIILE